MEMLKLSTHFDRENRLKLGTEVSKQMQFRLLSDQGSTYYHQNRR